MSDHSVIDEMLIAAIRENDYAGFNRLFARYYSSLCRYVYRILQNKEDTEDVVQELFLRIWNNRKKIEINDNVSAYLHKMAKNMALNHIRSADSYKNLLESQKSQPIGYEDDLLESDEFSIALYDCINRLPNRCREVFLLHRMQGVKLQEIAEQLNISIKTIKNQIWSSLQKLKICLEEKGIEG
jgi:RNA polymerase sigma-70 factor (ECF subfamily)